MSSKPAAPSIVFLDAATLGDATDALSVLAECHPCKIHAVTSPEETAARIAGHSIVVTNKVALRADLLASPAAEALRLIAVAATGVDIIDLDAARSRGVAVANVVGYSTRSVAEHTWSLILELATRTGRLDHAVRAGGWSSSPIFTMFDYPRVDLAGKTLGIVGHGAIGRAVAAIGAAFGMTVLIAARPGASGAVPVDRVPFDEVLTRSDVVSLHCPLTDATRGLINAATLARMKREAWLVNTARGALVDDEALVEALRSRRLGGAALDVLTREPPPAAHPIVRAMPELPTLVVTPHVAWTSREARLRLSEGIADNIHAFLRGERRNRVV